MANWYKVQQTQACKRACKLFGLKGFTGQLFGSLQASINKSTGTCMIESDKLTRRREIFYTKLIAVAQSKGHEAGWKKNKLGIWFKYQPAQVMVQ